MTAEEPGMRLCKCITETKNQDGSCDFFVQGVGQPSQSFYKNKVDYYRETIPYIGRFWSHHLLYMLHGEYPRSLGVT